MTRTEERLTDALRASASRVRDDQLRPLADVAVPGWGTGTAWRRWLAPLAAAASVALVIGVIVAVGHQSQPRSGPAVSVASARPSYVVVPDGVTSGLLNVSVRAVSTGKVVGTQTPPAVPSDVHLYYGTVAAGPDDRTFYVAYNAVIRPVVTTDFQIWIYRFALTSSGTLTPMTRVTGGVLPGYLGSTVFGTMAVSPDGTQLALTVNSGRPAVQRIVVVDLLTASRTSWQGGLSRSGMLFGIPALSWTADGRSLVFTGSWCTVARGPMWCEQGVRRDDEVFSLNPADGGGSLSSARPLLTQSARYPLIVAAYAGPSGTDIVAVVLSGSVRASGSAVVWSDLAVLDISPASGAVVDVLYRHAGTNHYPVWLAPDPSDRYFLLEADGLSAPDAAWIGGGALHPLGFQGWQVSW